MVLDSQGPVLISEPRSSVEFSNETGAMIHCSAQGSPLPRIDWLMGDESPVLPIPHIREMLVNGSMYFLPFGAETYRHDVHSAVYRCQASNSVGRVLGREITVKAGEYLYFFSFRPIAFPLSPGSCAFTRLRGPRSPPLRHAWKILRRPFDRADYFPFPLSSYRAAPVPDLRRFDYL